MNGAAKVYSIDIGETGDDFQALSARFPGQVFALQADVTKEASISAAVDKIVEEAGALHGMVVNAGRTNHKSALDFTTEEIEALFSVNVGHLNLTLVYFLTKEWISSSEHSTQLGLPPGHSSSSVSRGRSSSLHQWPPTDPTRYVIMSHFKVPSSSKEK